MQREITTSKDAPRDEAAPSLLDERYRRLYLADEARATGGAEPPAPGWPPAVRTDYRAFIADAIEASGCSQRALAESLGKAPAMMTHLVRPRFDDPQRKRVSYLSGPLLAQLGDALALPHEEAELLRHLVNLETARRTGEGDPAFFTRLIEQAWVRDTGYLPHQEMVVYARRFLNVVVREMVGLIGFSPEPEWLMNHLWHPLTAPASRTEVARVWQALVRLGVVEQDDAGRWRRGPRDIILGAGQAERSAVLKAFYRHTLDAARDALLLDSHRRQFECRTISVRREAIEVISAAFGTLLDGLAETGDGEGESVMHVQLMAFPVADVNGWPEEVER